MKQLFWLLGSFFTCCLIWVILVASQIGKPDPKTLHVRQIFEKKEAYAYTINSPKLAIIAGSNAQFGINSKKLEHFWHIRVVNAAVIKGFGMKYMLDRSKKILKPGDIALLPLEYTFYQEDSALNEHYAQFILSNDPHYFYNLPFLEKVIIIARIELPWVITSMLNKSKKSLKTDSDIYGPHNINQRGDHINIPAKRSEATQIIINNMLPEKYDEAEISQNFINVMNDYIYWAKSSDICLIVMPPTYMYFEKYQNQYFAEFQKNIRNYFSRMGISFIGNFYDYMYPEEMYFDSRYHLNPLGRNQRTTQIITDIGPKLRSHCM